MATRRRPTKRPTRSTRTTDEPDTPDRDDGADAPTPRRRTTRRATTGTARTPARRTRDAAVTAADDADGDTPRRRTARTRRTTTGRTRAKAPAEDNGPSEDEDTTPTRRRRTARTRRAASPADEEKATPTRTRRTRTRKSVDADTEEDAPRRTRRTRTAKTDSEDDAPARPRRTRARKSADVATDEDAPRRTRRTRTAKTDSEDDAPARPRRTRARKSADAETDKDAPRRTRRSRTARTDAEEDAPARPRRARARKSADVATDEDAPRRTRRTRTTKTDAEEDAPRRTRGGRARPSEDDEARPRGRGRPRGRRTDADAAGNGAPARGRRTRKAPAARDSRRQPRRETTRKPSRSRSGSRDRGRAPRSRKIEARAPRPLPKVKQEIIASVNPRESRIALMEDGRLAELLIDRPDSPNLVGTIILGRVDTVIPGIEAAFVDVGLEKNGFLYVQDIIGAPGDFDILDSLEQDARPRRYQRHHISKLLKKDQVVMVQVKKEPMGGKGTRLTSYLTLPGRYCVMMPNTAQLGVSRKIEDTKERDRLRRIVRKVQPPGVGLILRTAAVGAHEDDIAADVEHVVALWERIQDAKEHAESPQVLHRDMTGLLLATRELFTEDVSRMVLDNRSAHEAVGKYLGHLAPHMVDRVELYDEDTPLFERYKLDHEIDLALDTRVPLPSGGYLLVDQTEAVVTIDVNTGSYTGSRRLEETVYATNLEAVDEVARQLRLRDLGGIVLIDFIDMESMAYRATVYQNLIDALQRDRSKTRVQDMSELCIVQLTRKRTKYSLAKTLCSQCPTCHGKGMLRSVTTQALHILREIEMKTRNLGVEHVLVEAHPTIAEHLSHAFAYELQDLEAYIETLVLIHPVEDKGHEYVKVIVEGTPLDAAGTARRRRRRGTRGGRGRRKTAAAN